MATPCRYRPTCTTTENEVLTLDYEYIFQSVVSDDEFAIVLEGYGRVVDIVDIIKLNFVKIEFGKGCNGGLV